MPTEVVAMGPAHLELVRRFSAETWPERLRSDEFYRWRYAECPVLAGYLAIRDGRCVAMATALQRPVRIGGQDVEVREAFDWYTLPRYRGSGIGVRVMRRMMEDPEPITVVGGTDDTRKLLPELGFRVPAGIRTFALPLGKQRFAEVLKQRARVPRPLSRAAMTVLGPLLVAPRPRRVPPGGRVLPVARIGPEAVALYARATHGTFPLWRLDQLRWLTHGFASTGAFVALYFTRGDELLGWSLLRIFDAAEGRRALIVDLFAPEPDVDLLTWMVSETTCAAAGFRPEVVNALTTSPELVQALQRNRFREGGSLPIHWWDQKRDSLPEPLFFGAQWGDHPLLPFPQRWWPSAGGAASGP